MFLKICGLPRTPNETPLEYGVHLARRFPTLGNDISWIVELYNQSVYGVTQPNEKQIMSARHSLNRVRSLRYWPARLKSWFRPHRGI
ncbi:MAG: DUF4129 domain-containing protein [Deltaproteobacteria bacterium]|nr:DUF4129 domain-containing protein [Deltaproteobacteria bacterium]